MKPNKILRNSILLLLTLGASLILGLLSFGGMFALWPILPFAFAAFALSVAYEGEIYFQNIKGALNKLFKRDHLKHQLAEDYLEKLEEDEKLPADIPFFVDYKKQLDIVKKFGNTHSNKDRKTEEKKLRAMRKWFATQLFADKGLVDDTYAGKVQQWLMAYERGKAKATFEKLRPAFHAAKAFSALAAIFMSLGTTYLLVETFAVIPILAAIPFAALPMLIVPMAIIAGAAYGFLTYNAITDMLKNDTLRKWYKKLKEDWTGKDKKKHIVKNIFMATMAIFLVSLAIALTICTAGTWWTVVKQTQPIFTWMTKMPGFIMGIINPIVTGLSAIVFNIENTSESLELIYDNLYKSGNSIRDAILAIQDALTELYKRENRLQLANPFRLLLKLTVTPLRMLLFIGHLLSMSVATNRVPTISEFFSTLLGFVSEGFEDGHYFIPHKHADHEGHNHAHDFPTKLLKIIFMPIYILATLWDFGASQLNPSPPPKGKPHSGEPQSLSFIEAWQKQTGEPEDVPVEIKAEERPSEGWKIEYADFRIERYKAKHLDGVALIGDDILREKKEALSALQKELRSGKDVRGVLDSAKGNAAYSKHRFFESARTTTDFVEELPRLVC